MAVEVEVEIKARHMIKPAEKTWTGKMKLSVIDMMPHKVFRPKLYLYNNNNKDKWDVASINNTLKESLAKVLVHFYPFTGRLIPIGGGRVDIHVDNDVTPGVPFLEGEVNADLSDLGEDLMEADVKGRLGNLFCKIDNPDEPLRNLALLVVQVTHFRCGGVAVAITVSHAVVDGIGFGHFYTEWTRLARGEPLGMTPVHDRNLLRVEEPPRSDQEFFKGTYEPPLSQIALTKPGADPTPLLQATVQVSKTQIDNMKQMIYDAKNGRPYTRFEVLGAHIWRCVTKAKEKEGKKAIALAMAMDIRKRINPPLPPKFNGNAAIRMTVVNEFEELNSNPLAYTCDKIRKTIDKVTDDVIWGFLDYKKTVDDLGAQRGTMTPEGILVQPDILMTNWMNLPFNNIDFGWGNESYWTFTTNTEGHAIIRDGCEEGSIIVSVCLKASQVDKFKYHFFHQLEYIKPHVTRFRVQGLSRL